MPTKSSQKTKRSSRKLKSLAVEKAGALSPRDTVDTAAKRMREMGSKKWPVVEGRTLIGMVEDTQPDVTMGSHGHDPKSWRVSEIMKRDTIFCYEDEDCAHACRLMEQHDLNYLPVVDRDMRIVGIFDREEIAKKAGLTKPTK
ncbi:MAG TPA: CBS domain-containing protein [Chthoniobacteraceae bacterium]|nr:CBS domain-containing protein [Chthoniobacteraceae bacterium]